MKEIEGWQTVDDESGLNMPWYTRPCLEWLQTIDLKGKKVFEYGVGNSTTWYKSKGAICDGVDSNAYWAGLAGALFFQDKKRYLDAINFQPYNYDIIVIDGLYRDYCLKFALDKIVKGGYIICDNYKQSEVEPDWPLTEQMIKDFDYVIYKEPKHYDWSTLVIHV